MRESLFSPTESVRLLNAEFKDKHLRNKAHLQTQRLPPHMASIKQAISKELYLLGYNAM
jgi:hypothetical protein